MSADAVLCACAKHLWQYHVIARILAGDEDIIVTWCTQSHVPDIAADAGWQTSL
jgi:hypothetical protein